MFQIQIVHKDQKVCSYMYKNGEESVVFVELRQCCETPPLHYESHVELYCWLRISLINKRLMTTMHSLTTR